MKKVLFITNVPSPYRVAFFNELGSYGGIELEVCFIESIYKQKHRLITWFSNNYTHFRPIFLKHDNFFASKMNLCLDIIKILGNNYDEIIFGGYSYPTMMLAMEYLNIKGKRFSIEIDGGIIASENFFKMKLKSHFLSSASKWYSSGKFSDKYLTHYGAKPEAIYHYPFSSVSTDDIDIEIDKEYLLQRKLLIKENMGFLEEKVVLAVGQFIHRKGFDILLEAALHLPHYVGIYIVGGEPTFEYSDYIQKHKITNVHFISFKNKNELRDFYLASDVFVLPTREDIWGLVINEALAYGIPVVTTDRCVAGIELIENGKNGYVVPSENAKALAEAIQKVLSSDSYIMRKYALDKAKLYTIENMAKVHKDIIMESKNI